jgi:Ca2+-transporting ATPase
VRGDALVLAEGDRVPADVLLLSGFGLQVDESLLTGESVPVRKRISVPVDDAEATPGGDDLPFLWSGTLVVRGRGVAEVRAIGADTELGRIGRILAGPAAEVTPLEREVAYGLSVEWLLGLCRARYHARRDARRLTSWQA